MTRKRFIKLAMSRGYSRNTAQRFADNTVGITRVFIGKHWEVLNRFKTPVYVCTYGVPWLDGIRDVGVTGEKGQPGV